MTLRDDLSAMEAYVEAIDEDRRRHPYAKGETWRFGDKLAESYRVALRKIRQADAREDILALMSELTGAR